MPLQRSTPLAIAAFFCLANSLFADTAHSLAGANALIQEWDRISFTLKKEDQPKPLEQLIAKAHSMNDTRPGQAPTLIWEGIAHATYAGVKGGLGALGECKTAKALFEQAIAADPTALHGAAWTSAGSLYYQVPGWPIGFGDDKKAEEMLLKGLEYGPAELDAHYFYADFLMKQKRKKEAVEILHKGLATPTDESRPLFQQARREKMQAMLKEAQNSN